MKYLDFSDGNKLPIVGLGTWQSEDEQVEAAVDTALEAGYRHIDTAYSYKNEKAIGKVLKEWLDAGKVKREELFITTKLPMPGVREDLVEHFCNLSLKALQLDYVDLYLIHVPVGLKYVNDENMFPQTPEKKLDIDKTTDLEKVWQAMEKLVEKGMAKSIGISNFSTDQVERIVSIAKIKPANLQVELNAYFRQKALVETCNKHGITVVAYGPFGSPGSTDIFKSIGLSSDVLPSLLDDPCVKTIAEKHNKNSAQILLRHLVQLDISPIPKSITKHRIIDNFQVFDFELDESDMEELDKLDKGEQGRRFIFSVMLPGSGDHPECRF